jgi:tetratricopeptide (TPR) repeat protein
MLLDPANLDKSFKYAELGIQIGDYEAAISALERMLLYNPDLPRVHLELGVLYFRLGSYVIARSYLTRAVKGDNVPDDVRARVAVFLDDIDDRLSKHRFSGSVYGGLRY